LTRSSPSQIGCGSSTAGARQNLKFCQDNFLNDCVDFDLFLYFSCRCTVRRKKRKGKRRGAAYRGITKRKKEKKDLEGESGW
jgi:hypothetical protein